MSTRKQEDARLGLLQGTLDLLILRTLVFGPEHGQGIARAIALRILGPAPHRQMLGNAAISASLGRGLALSKAAIAMIMPGSQ